MSAWLNDGILAGKPWSGSVRRVEYASKATTRSWRWVASVSVSASLCYRQVEPESAVFHSHVLDSCLEGSDGIPSGGKMCRHVPRVRSSTMWRS